MIFNKALVVGVLIKDVIRRAIYTDEIFNNMMDFGAVFCSRNIKSTAPMIN
jgi:hypothetical protein